MTLGLPISLAIHAIAFALALVTFGAEPDVVSVENYIAVEIIDVANFTNVEATRKGPKTEEPATRKDPKVDDKKSIDTIDETPIVDTTPTNFETLGDPKDATRDKDDNLGTDDITDQTDASDAPTTTEQSDPNASANANDDIGDKTQKSSGVNLDDISKLLNIIETEDPNKYQQTNLQGALNRLKFTSNTQVGAGTGEGLTLAVEDALRSAMYKCWRAPQDAPNPETLIVQVRAKFSPTGDVLSSELEDPAAVARSPNPYMSIAADRAVRAVSICGPYKFLPPEQFGVWGEMVLTFAPEL